MDISTRRILLIAVIAGLLGAGTGLALNGAGPLQNSLSRTEAGQRWLQGVKSDGNAPPAPKGLAIATLGQPMPAVRLQDLDGRPVELPGAYRGRPILINFWASWCGPCIKEMPELDRFAADQDANGTQVVGIALDAPDRARAFLQTTPVGYPVLLDVPGPRDSSVQLGNARGVLPYTVLIGADGRLVKYKLGPFEAGEIEGWDRQ